jgi:predicted dehydrogenase/nucleoside-diphosphate-sugar epimerase
MTSIRIGCIGAGFISDTHAAVLRDLPGVELTAVVEPVSERADAFAKQWGVGAVFGSVDSLVGARAIDAAHVLVPPPLHRETAEKLLRAGIHVLLEKPMAQSGDECAELQEAARASGVVLRVNHNAIEQPAHRTLRRILASNRIGTVRHVSCRFNLPLRQLAARQFSHWMFATPLNLLLEQAVHPLSQIDDIVGQAEAVTASWAQPLRIGAGREICRTWLVSLRCARGTAQLYLSLGESYPSWGMTVIGDDGVLHVDYLANRVVKDISGPRMDVFDKLATGYRQAGELVWQASSNFLREAAAMARLAPRSDAFYLSMKESIASFYRDIARPDAERTGAQGRRMVELCERIAGAAGIAHGEPASRSVPTDAGAHDVLIIGGTGFIGTHLVRRLVANGVRVGVLARSVSNLPDIFADPHVCLFRGDARNEEDVARALGTASIVVNLAHGGGGRSRAEIEASLVGAATAVAEAAMARGVRRLVFVSSIASLYLGDAADRITGATPPDPKADERADYSRAKVLAERALLELHRTRGLAVTILRPGVVIGDGGTPFHSGIGFYNRETHCLGWNLGRNPLPLVLAEEVADAIIHAMSAPEIDGRCYNIVSDVRLTAREYIAELARVTGRPLHYHPQSVFKLYAIESAKALVKRLTGRGGAWPSLRDLKSRGLVATFDCSDAMRDLGWQPERDRAAFLRQGFALHGEAA